MLPESAYDVKTLCELLIKGPKKPLFKNLQTKKKCGLFNRVLNLAAKHYWPKSVAEYALHLEVHGLGHRGTVNYDPVQSCWGICPAPPVGVRIRDGVLVFKYYDSRDI